MPTPSFRLTDEAATRRFGHDLSAVLQAGDTVLLSGALGAGKTTLARSIIRGLLGDSEHVVPSPTYTLMQSYDWHGTPVTHLDLYRIEDAAECQELGLEEVFGHDLTLVEWPERLGPYRPARFLELELSQRDAETAERMVQLSERNCPELHQRACTLLESSENTNP